MPCSGLRSWVETTQVQKYQQQKSSTEHLMRETSMSLTHTYALVITHKTHFCISETVVQYTEPQTHAVWRYSPALNVRQYIVLIQKHLRQKLRVIIVTHITQKCFKIIWAAFSLDTVLSIWRTDCLHCGQLVTSTNSPCLLANPYLFWNKPSSLCTDY